MSSPRPWIVFADDWGRHPSSCQHLVGHCLTGRSVTWINTIGTRPIRFDLRTAGRIVEKLKSWFRPVKPPAPVLESKPSPRVLSPKMWPSFRSKFGRNLNRKILQKSLRKIAAESSEPPIIISTLPLVADLVGAIPGARWIYYCVDDFGVWPGYDGETMRAMERELVPKVDAIIAVSETLQTHLRCLGRDSHLLTHGVDLDHWSVKTESGRPAELDGIESPILLFWGVIDRRMDLDFLREIRIRIPRATPVLVGPQEDPDPALFQIPGIAIRPAVPYARLPELAAGADALIMPYADIPATRAMQPLKLKEYLATGKPVVVRDLPATRDWAEACDLASTPESFARALALRLKEGLAERQTASRGRLGEESWVAKARRFEGWVNNSNSHFQN